MKNILVTGANGFVGLHLINELLKNENLLIYALVRKASSIKIKHHRLQVIQGDLFSLDSLDKIEQLDQVIHTAGIVHSFYPHDFFSTNTDGTQNLLSKIKNKNISKFILISSLAAAGPSQKELAHKEEFELNPVSLYGKSKLKAEEILKNFEGSFEKIIIRPPMVIGPNDPAVLDVFKMVKDRLIILPGMDSKSKEYSFVCVFDLVQGIVRAMDYQTPSKKTEEIFYIAHPKKISFQELIETINHKMGAKSLFYLTIPTPIIFIFSIFLKMFHKVYKHKLRLTPDKTAELSPMSWTCSSEKSIRLLKMNYLFDLNETIRVTIKNYQDQNWI